MEKYNLELKEKITVRAKMISIIKKADDFVNKLIRAFLSFVPWWFKLMGWLIISGAIFYVYLKYKSYIFGLLFSVSLLFLVFFIILSIRKKFSFLNKYTQKYLLLDFFLSIFSIILTILIFIFLVYVISGFSLP